jgi:hypothetical protein
MEWSGRGPAPPAIEAGEGRQRQAVNHHCLDCCDAYPTSGLGHLRLKRDVRVTSAYPSISDMTWQRLERRNGPTTDIGRTNFCPQGEATSISAEPIAALAGRLLLTAFDGVHGASMISLS